MHHTNESDEKNKKKPCSRDIIMSVLFAVVVIVILVVIYFTISRETREYPDYNEQISPSTLTPGEQRAFRNYSSNLDKPVERSNVIFSQPRRVNRRRF